MKMSSLLLVPMLFLLPGELSSEEDAATFGNPYKELEGPQRALVNDWFDRRGDTSAGEPDPAMVYNDLPISVKTTIEAVTHALLTTSLTNDSGESLGTALDRVAWLETVKGKVKGTRGDRQFRLYAVLKEGSINALNASPQFRRGRNLVYHKGYPLSYRLRGGAPSIQFSVSRDLRHVDIDVDYRSARFPVSLFNGHLRASNSDVRAGKNYDRHTGRWKGLRDWWDNWFGFPLLNRKDREVREPATAVSALSRKGTGNIEEAVEDFLRVWLVEEKPEMAIGYVADRAYRCLSSDLPDESPPHRRTAPDSLVMQMRDISEALGPQSTLDGVAEGVQLAGLELRAVEQPYANHFSLYSLSDGQARASECAEQEMPAPSSGDPGLDGNYFSSVLYLNGGAVRSGTLALLWAKENEAWRIVSWELEPGFDPDDAPDLHGNLTSTVERQRGDPVFVETNHRFLTAWQEGQIDLVADYFSDRALTCQNLFLGEEEAPIQGEAALKGVLKKALRSISSRLREAPTLGQALQPVQVTDPDLKVVEHDHEESYTLVSSPEFLARSLDCDYRLSGGDPLPDPGCRSYGLYYGTLLQLRVPGGDPAVLVLMWAKEDDRWKVVSYDLATP